MRQIKGRTLNALCNVVALVVGTLFVITSPSRGMNPTGQYEVVLGDHFFPRLNIFILMEAVLRPLRSPHVNLTQHSNTFIQTLNEGIAFGRVVLHSSSRVQSNAKSMPRCTEAVLASTAVSAETQ